MQIPKDPRVRLVLVLLVVVIAGAISVHLVLMGAHGMAMMLGLCLAILSAAAALVLPGRPLVPALGAPSPLLGNHPGWPRLEPTGRHPPDEGIRLRH